MPDTDALARMYGPAYANAGGADASVEEPKTPEAVLARLRTRRPGMFVDFGCGSGSLLAPARDLGWTAVGVEFDAYVVRQAAARTGCVIFNGLEELRRSAVVPADVIHLGDVVEHLTAPLDILRTQFVSLLRQRGGCSAQGPLEAGLRVLGRPARRTVAPLGAAGGDRRITSCRRR